MVWNERLNEEPSVLGLAARTASKPADGHEFGVAGGIDPATVFGPADGVGNDVEPGEQSESLRRGPSTA